MYDTQGIDISSDALEKLEQYHALLLKWNKAINLVSPSTIKDAWRRHFIDSAQISAHIPDDTKTYADLGCGGGFPGLVIAVMRPALTVHLVESDERKGQFMRTVIRETGITNAQVHTKRIEHAIEDIEPDFVTARALASLSQLFEYCMPWAEASAKLQFCFMKGGRAEEEIEEAQKQFSFSCTRVDSITDASAQLLLIQDLKAQ